MPLERKLEIKNLGRLIPEKITNTTNNKENEIKTTFNLGIDNKNESIVLMERRIDFSYKVSFTLLYPHVSHAACIKPIKV